MPMRRAVSESSRAPGSVSIATARADVRNARRNVRATRVRPRPGDRTRARGQVTRILDREWVLSATWCFLVFSVRALDVLSDRIGALKWL